MKDYGVGIIGCGFMGKVHVYNYKTIPSFYQSPPLQTRLVGVCDSNESAA